MFFVVITGLIALLCAWGILKGAKDRNPLGILVSLTATGIFGWFTIMTFLDLLKKTT